MAVEFKDDDLFKQALKELKTTTTYKSNYEDPNFNEFLFHVPKDTFKNLVSFQSVSFSEKGQEVEIDTIESVFIHVIQSKEGSTIVWPKQFERMSLFALKEQKEQMGIPEDVGVFLRDEIWKAKEKNWCMTFFHSKDDINFSKITKLEREHKRLFHSTFSKPVLLEKKILRADDKKVVVYINNHEKHLGSLHFTTLNKFNVVSLKNGKVIVLDTPTLLLPFSAVQKMLNVGERVKEFGQKIKKKFFLYCYYAVRDIFGILKVDADSKNQFTASVTEAWERLKKVDIDTLKISNLLPGTLELETSLREKKISYKQLAKKFSFYYSEDWSNVIKKAREKKEQRELEQREAKEKEEVDRQENLTEAIEIVNKIFERAKDNASETNPPLYKVEYTTYVALTKNNDEVADFPKHFFNEYHVILGKRFKARLLQLRDGRIPKIAMNEFSNTLELINEYIETKNKVIGILEKNKQDNADYAKFLKEIKGHTTLREWRKMLDFLTADDDSDDSDGSSIAEEDFLPDIMPEVSVGLTMWQVQDTGISSSLSMSDELNKLTEKALTKLVSFDDSKIMSQKFQKELRRLFKIYFLYQLLLYKRVKIVFRKKEIVGRGRPKKPTLEIVFLTRKYEETEEEKFKSNLRQVLKDFLDANGEDAETKDWNRVFLEKYRMQIKFPGAARKRISESFTILEKIEKPVEEKMAKDRLFLELNALAFDNLDVYLTIITRKQAYFIKYYLLEWATTVKRLFYVQDFEFKRTYTINYFQAWEIFVNVRVKQFLEKPVDRRMELTYRLILHPGENNANPLRYYAFAKTQLKEDLRKAFSTVDKVLEKNVDDYKKNLLRHYNNMEYTLERMGGTILSYEFYKIREKERKALERSNNKLYSDEKLKEREKEKKELKKKLLFQDVDCITLFRKMVKFNRSTLEKTKTNLVYKKLLKKINGSIKKVGEKCLRLLEKVEKAERESLCFVSERLFAILSLFQKVVFFRFKKTLYGTGEEEKKRKNHAERIEKIFKNLAKMGDEDLLSKLRTIDKSIKDGKNDYNTIINKIALLQDLKSALEDLIALFIRNDNRRQRLKNKKRRKSKLNEVKPKTPKPKKFKPSTPEPKTPEPKTPEPSTPPEFETRDLVFKEPTEYSLLYDKVRPIRAKVVPNKGCGLCGYYAFIQGYNYLRASYGGQKIMKSAEDLKKEVADVVIENYPKAVQDRLNVIKRALVRAKTTASKSGQAGWMNDDCLTVLASLYNVCVLVYQESGDTVSYQQILPTVEYEKCQNNQKLWLYNTDNVHFEWLKDVVVSWDYEDDFDAGFGDLSHLKALRL